MSPFPQLMSMLAAAVLAAAALCPTAGAMWANVNEDVPVERVIPNVQRYIDKYPEDAAGYYVLGRIHSLAWAGSTGNVSIIPESKRTAPANKPAREPLPGFAPYQSVRVQRPEKAGPLTPDARRHLLDSIHYYRTAVELEPSNALYQLGLAWMAEQAMAYGPGVTGRPAAQWRRLALAANRKAFELARQKDLAKNAYGGAGNDMISLEAAQGLQRLLTNPGANEKKELAALEEHISAIRSKPRWVTPIIVPLGGETELEQLLAPRSAVRFDLAGDGAPRRWGWVAPQAGLLVWDPRGSGQITSGRQLFGSVTWWMFWKDGYQALAALDDDGDGHLSGTELNGLALWRDANHNGVSEPGEVRPVAAHGIAALTVASDQTLPDGSLRSSRGVHWHDGRVTASYDWLARQR